MQYCYKQLDDLVIDDEPTGTARLQPCKSPVWDTAITLRALAASGVAARQPAMRRGRRLALGRQTTRRGDWSETVAAEPGGWCFEYANEFYPDCDDTAMVLMALQTQFDAAAGASRRLPPELAVTPAVGRQRRQPARQERHATRRRRRIDDAGGHRPRAPLAAGHAERDGGWGAFDRDNDRQFLCHVPFADHNAMIDPSTPDLTGRVLECPGPVGLAIGPPGGRSGRGLHPPGAAGRRQLVRPLGRQLHLRHLAVADRPGAVGVPADDPAMMAGANWLLAHQQPGGGWGESPDSYEQPQLRGQGPSDRLANGLGGAGPAGRRAGGASGHARGVRYSSARSAPTAPGTSPNSPAPVFRGSSICDIITIRSISRLMALARWAVRIQPRLGQDYAARPPARRAGANPGPWPTTAPFPCVSPSR